MPTIRDSAERIEQVLAGQSAQFSRVFYEAIAAIRDATTIDELARLLEAGNYEAALRTIERGAAMLGNQYGRSLAASAEATAAWLATEALDITVSFDMSNTRAVERMQLNRLRLIQNFTQEQREMLRGVLSDGIARGLNPKEQARLFRQSIGLTATQENHVRNYRNELETVGREGSVSYSEATRRQLRSGASDRTIASAMRRNVPLTNSQIDAMVDAYRKNYIAYRAKVISRTEALRAVNEGTEELFLQAVEEGQLDENALVRTWVTARDERVRSSHAILNGQKRALGEFWQTENGRLRYPGDPSAPPSETVQCRCIVTTEFKI